MNPIVTYELAMLRPTELRHEADRHRLAATIRARRTRPGFRFPGHGRNRAQR
ncbi:MAG: hypothetical protein ICV72_14115 [Aldersonia sp.]|nr:hypothetical protein [Aldersonia sp.]